MKNFLEFFKEEYVNLLKTQNDLKPAMVIYKIWNSNLYNMLQTALNEKIGALNGKSSAAKVAQIKDACKEVVKEVAKTMLNTLKTHNAMHDIDDKTSFQHTIKSLVYYEEHIRKPMVHTLKRLNLANTVKKECETLKGIVFKVTEPRSLQEALLQDTELNLGEKLKNYIEHLSFKLRSLPYAQEEQRCIGVYGRQGSEANFMVTLSSDVHRICEYTEIDNFKTFAHKLAYYLQDKYSLSNAFGQLQGRFSWEAIILNEAESMVKEVLNKKDGFFQKWAQKKLPNWDENSVNKAFEGDAGTTIRNALKETLDRTRGNGLFANFTPWSWSSIGRFALLACSALALAEVALKYCFGVSALSLLSGLVVSTSNVPEGACFT